MELARIAGYQAPGGVNLHYGRFGFDLSKKLRWTVPSGDPFACSLATFWNPDPGAINGGIAIGDAMEEVASEV
jgi:hypothetical protein